MADVYDTPRTEVTTNLQASVGAYLAEQILAAIDSGGGAQSPGIAIVSDFVPGNPIPENTDIVVVRPGEGGAVNVPARRRRDHLHGSGGRVPSSSMLRLPSVYSCPRGRTSSRSRLTRRSTRLRRFRSIWAPVTTSFSGRRMSATTSSAGLATMS